MWKRLVFHLTLRITNSEIFNLLSTGENFFLIGIIWKTLFQALWRYSASWKVTVTFVLWILLEKENRFLVFLELCLALNWIRFCYIFLDWVTLSAKLFLQRNQSKMKKYLARISDYNVVEHIKGSVSHVILLNIYLKMSWKQEKYESRRGEYEIMETLFV